MPEVQQRLLVHRLVLENAEHRLCPVEHRMARLLDVSSYRHSPVTWIKTFRARARSSSQKKTRW